VLSKKIANLSIVVPIYREAKVITAFLSELKLVLDGTALEYEVIVVIDGDEDHTSEVLKKIKWPQLFFVVNECNYGKGYSIRKGVELANSDRFIGFIDGDSDINPKALADGINKLEDFETLDFVYGSKLHFKSTLNYPFERKIQSWFFAKLVSRLFHLNTMDTQTGLKIGRSTFMKKVVSETKLSGFAFDVQFFSIAEASGFTHEAIPIELSFNSISNVNLKQSLTAVKDLLTIYFSLKRTLDE
jgi:dolichyl-phosphate beta-glucosyltransferase